MRHFYRFHYPTSRGYDVNTELEMGAPTKGFLVDPGGKPIMSLGRTIDVSFSLEASGELSSDPAHIWASDTGLPIEGYVLEPPQAQPP